MPFGRIVTHDHAALRHPADLQRRRQGRLRGARRQRAPTCPSSSRQRADFFEEEVGLETTLKRPIVNTRDEPHCDPQKYRRLHVIIGDANLSEVATYLKVGTTAIVLAMIEDDVLGTDLVLANPVPAIRQVSHDPTLPAPMLLRRRPAGHRARDPVGAARAGAEVRARARPRGGGRGGRRRRHAALGGGAHRPRDAIGRVVAHWVDWVAKYRLVRGYSERHGIAAERRPAAGARPAVPRPAGRTVARRPGRAASA